MESDVFATRVREHDGSLVRRAWTRSERRIVIMGLCGRLLIAIEPIVCFAVFAAITIALIFFPAAHGSTLTHFESAIVIAPVFGIAALAFAGWTVAVLVAPLRAFRQTFAPIYIVDGYVRYRRPDPQTEANSNGYVAVLNDERHEIVEWPSLGSASMIEALRPAMIEFSYYGGIHRIDGRSTGVVPEKITPLSVGMNSPRA